MRDRLGDRHLGVDAAHRRSLRLATTRDSRQRLRWCLISQFHRMFFLELALGVCRFVAEHFDPGAVAPVGLLSLTDYEHTTAQPGAAREPGPAPSA